MKTQTRVKTQTKTQFVAVTTDFQTANQQVEKAYTLIVRKAIDLLKRFDVKKYRTYCEMDHSKNELNSNLLCEYLSYFHNITLSINPKNEKYYIFVDLAREALEKFGSNLCSQLLRVAYEATQSNDNTNGIEYALKINLIPADQLHNFYYRRIVDGETNYVSIHTVEKDVEVN